MFRFPPDIANCILPLCGGRGCRLFSSPHYWGFYCHNIVCESCPVLYSVYTVYVVTLFKESKSFVKYSLSFTVSYDSNIHFSATNYMLHVTLFYYLPITSVCLTWDKCVLCVTNLILWLTHQHQLILLLATWVINSQSRGVPVMWHGYVVLKNRPWAPLVNHVFSLTAFFTITSLLKLI